MLCKKKNVKGMNWRRFVVSVEFMSVSAWKRRGFVMGVW